MVTQVKARFCYPAGKCPECRHTGYYDDLIWKPEDGLDPALKKVYCRGCDTAYYLAPIRRNGEGNDRAIKELFEEN